MKLPSVHCHCNRPLPTPAPTTIRHNRFGCFRFCVVAVIVICIICTIRIEFLTNILECAQSGALVRDCVSNSVRRSRANRKILYYRRRLNKPSQMRNAGRTVHTLLSSGLTIYQANKNDIVQKLNSRIARKTKTDTATTNHERKKSRNFYIQL